MTLLTVMFVKMVMFMNVVIMTVLSTLMMMMMMMTFVMVTVILIIIMIILLLIERISDTSHRLNLTKTNKFILQPANENTNIESLNTDMIALQ